MLEVIAWLGLNCLVLMGAGAQPYQDSLAQFNDLEYRLLWVNGGYSLALLGIIFQTQNISTALF